MTEINYGHIYGSTYRKVVSFSKAVLWKDREISLHKKIVDKYLGDNSKIFFVEFLDPVKKELWRAPLPKLQKIWRLKQEGQEPQYYMPIEAFSRKSMDKNGS
jgi:hypothetical protein